MKSFTEQICSVIKLYYPLDTLAFFKKKDTNQQNHKPFKNLRVLFKEF